MESRPAPLLIYVGLAATSAKAAIRATNGTTSGCCGLPTAGSDDSLAPWLAAQINGLKLVRLTASDSTATNHGNESPTWVTSLSGSNSGRWFFAQAPDPEDEDPEEAEDKDEADAEPQRRNAPAVRKPSASEDSAEQLRGGGTINPPFP